MRYEGSCICTLMCGLCVCGVLPVNRAVGSSEANYIEVRFKGRVFRAHEVHALSRLVHHDVALVDLVTYQSK